MRLQLDKPESDQGCCCSQRAKCRGFTGECTIDEGYTVDVGDSIGRLVRGCRNVWGTRRYGTSQNYCLIPSGFKCSQSWFSGTPRQHNAHSAHTQVCMHTHTKRHINPQINNIVRFTITKRGYVSCHYTLVQCGCVDHSLPYKSLFFCCVTLTPNFYLYMKIMSVYKSE